MFKSLDFFASFFAVILHDNTIDLIFDHNVMHTLGASATLNLGERAKVLYNDISGMRLFSFSIVILPNSRTKEDEWTFPNLTARWTGEAS